MMKAFKTKFLLNAGWLVTLVLLCCVGEVRGQLGPQYKMMSLGGQERQEAISGNKHYTASFEQLTEYDMSSGETRWYDATNVPWTTFQIASIKAAAQGKLWVYLYNGSLWLKDGENWTYVLNYISTDPGGIERMPHFISSSGDSLYIVNQGTDTLYRVDHGQMSVVRVYGPNSGNLYVGTVTGNIGIIGLTGVFELYDPKGDSLLYTTNLPLAQQFSLQETASDKFGQVYLWGQLQYDYYLLKIASGQVTNYRPDIQPLMVGVQPNSLNFEIFSGFDDSLRVKIVDTVFALHGNQFLPDTFYTHILANQSKWLHSYNFNTLHAPRKFSDASGAKWQTYYSFEGEFSGWNPRSRVNFVDPTYLRFSYLPGKVNWKGVGVISNMEVGPSGMVYISGFAGCMAGQGEHWQNVIPESVYPWDILKEDSVLWVLGQVYDGIHPGNDILLMRFSPSGFTWSGLPFAAADSKLYKDRYNRIWIWSNNMTQISYYTVAGGLVNNPFNGGGSQSQGACVDAQGEIYFALNHVLYQIGPQLNQIDMQVPPAYANLYYGIKTDRLDRVLLFMNNGTLIKTQQGWVLDPNLSVSGFHVFHCNMSCIEEVDEKIHFDSQNHIWWVDNNGILNEYDWNQVLQYGITQYMHQPPYVVINDPLVLAGIDSVGNKWLFDNYRLLLLFNENGIQEVSNLTSASGNVFHDRDANAQLDTQIDGSIPFAMVDLSPGYHSFTNQNGQYAAVLPFNDYTITGPQIPSFDLTTDSIVYHLSLNDPDGRDSIDFGYESNTVTDSFEITVVTTAFHCGSSANIWVNARNRGTTTRNCEVLLHLDTLCNLIGINGGQMIQPGTVRWEITNFEPFNQRYFLLMAAIPGIIDTVVGPFPDSLLQLGDSIVLTVSLNYFDDNNQSQLGDEADAHQIFRCAYDPNDKTALPNGPSTGDSTLMDTPLDYVIRFQNTGNATAFHVQIRDTLDLRLDWSSFEIISASHLMSANIYSDRFVTFDFPNINLVDSFTNEPASHGYVRYRIRPRAGLVEGSSVRNTAHIYFDQNPPIVTNTTQTIFVEELDGQIVSSGHPHHPTSCLCEAWPNPFSTSTHLRFSNPGREKVQIFVFNTLGQQVFSTTSYGSEYDLKRQDLAVGLYRVVVNSGSCVGSCNVVVY